MAGSLEAISYERGRLQLLEQRKLPLESVFMDIAGPKECWTAIRDMTVRGAPAIAISAALSVAVDLVNGGRGAQFAGTAEAVEYITSQLDYLVTRWACMAHMLAALAVQGVLKLLATPLLHGSCHERISWGSEDKPFVSLRTLPSTRQSQTPILARCWTGTQWYPGPCQDQPLLPACTKPTPSLHQPTLQPVPRHAAGPRPSTCRTQHSGCHA